MKRFVSNEIGGLPLADLHDEGGIPVKVPVLIDGGGVQSRRLLLTHGINVACKVRHVLKCMYPSLPK
jgi:hypothetical protein